ncbi:hypothetical protein B9G98_03112 [Wickerhamiella sorbophila]|uniref:Uncharacterized protein n=1 Tax=Wickerhamiella sorbophila TaxID=45607 RepID=A0A2T0FKI9_9ASCO|nr:hypothetical protein B9G98_03112 [Wickerhamiella sorbophila]PRT55492.1 hypothetical protein B9G98_03112 [Wickerhamiella sorbophila]
MPGADEVTQGPADELEAPEPLAIVEPDCAPELEAPEPVAATEPDCAAELEAPDWLGVAEPDSRLSWARGVHSVRWARSNRSQSDGTTSARFQQRNGDRRRKRSANLVDTVDKLVDVVDISTVVAATRLGENRSKRTNDAVQATDKTRKNQFEDGSQDTAAIGKLLCNILNNSDQVINDLEDRQQRITSETRNPTKGSKQSVDGTGNCSKQRAKRANITGGGKPELGDSPQAHAVALGIRPVVVMRVVQTEAAGALETAEGELDTAVGALEAAEGALEAPLDPLGAAEGELEAPSDPLGAAERALEAPSGTLETAEQ